MNIKCNHYILHMGTNKSCYGLCSDGCPKPHAIMEVAESSTVISSLSSTGIGSVSAVSTEGGELACNVKVGRRRALPLSTLSLLLPAAATNSCPCVTPPYLGVS